MSRTRIVNWMSLCLWTTFALAQDAGGAPETSTVTIGTWFSLTSEILGEERPYAVYVPRSYDLPAQESQRYPVLYLLDGRALFHSASGVVQFMSSGINGNTQIPELIVVAIANTNRTRDLTPTHTTVGFDGEQSAFFEDSGGGDAFLRFIRQELFPEIESTYRTLPYRTLVGHSFGGLLALHALVDAPEMFQAYVAIDPSLWWDGQRLVQQAERYFAGDRDLRGAVYLSLANTPDLGSGAPSIMQDAGRRIAAILEGVETPIFRSRLQFFAAEDHGSVPLLSLYHGLLHVFDGYKPSLADFRTAPERLAEHFERLSARLGMELLPPEAMVNRLGYTMLQQVEDVDKAIEFFELNAANYPGSFNVQDSLGEAYMAKGERAAAIEAYRRSLDLNPASDKARQRLQELGAARSD